MYRVPLIHAGERTGGRFWLTGPIMGFWCVFLVFWGFLGVGMLLFGVFCNKIGLPDDYNSDV